MLYIKRKKVILLCIGYYIKLFFYFVRFDWEKCVDVVLGGVVRWKEFLDGKTFNDLVDVLFLEI